MPHNEPFDENDLDKLKNFVEKNVYKIRYCADYRDEYKECKSITGRFQQYFVDGEFTDCSRWKEDFRNCEKSLNDLKAAYMVIRHEEERYAERLKLHEANDVWKRRENPPSNWDSELPDFLKQNQKDSFAVHRILGEKACVIF